MAKTVSKSSIAAKLGAKGQAAFEEHKSDETQFDTGGGLPEGIEGGIAQLVDCRFSQYEKGPNKGEFFFLAQGVVVEPKEVNGIPIEGLRTMIMEPVCDTTKRDGTNISINDHLGIVLNHLRLLGVDTNELGFEDLDPTAEALKEAGPFFRFRTWKGKASKEFPNPRVNHVWNGQCEYEPAEGGSDVEEATPEPAPKKAKKSDKPSPKGKKKSEPEPEPEADAVDYATEDDVDVLAAAATDSNEKAQSRLGELALAAGFTTEQIEAAESWEALAATIKEGPAEEEAADDSEDWKPAEGEVYGYCPIDPKTKKPSKKAIEIEVVAVDTKKETVDLKNLDNQKIIYKAVAWSALTSLDS
jgi:hypothetical protein